LSCISLKTHTKSTNKHAQYRYIYDDAKFTSLSEAARYHIDHVGTTDQDFYFKIGDDSSKDDGGEEEENDIDDIPDTRYIYAPLQTSC